MVFDTGALVELLEPTSKIGEELKASMAEGSINAHVSEVSLAELYYVMCRRLRHERATSRYEDLRASNYLYVTETSSLTFLAGRYKCERSMSLADCFSLALGKHLRLPVLFRSREQELELELKKKPFDLQILFLEDYGRTTARHR